MRSNVEFLSPISKPIVELLEPAIVRRLHKEKRGQGYGKHYKPFLTVRDVPSKGRSHRRPSITHGRIVHLLSDLELAIFLLLDWSDKVIDIREQFPLDPEKTVNIANRLGIKHPSYNGITQIMSTDFLVDMKIGEKVVRRAITAKYCDDLENPRVLEKLELEHRFWEGEKVELIPFTEDEVPKTLVQNIKWLLPHVHSFDLDEESQLTAFNNIYKAIDTYPADKVAVVMKKLDEQKREKPGTYLQYLRHLLAQRAFEWDMSEVNHRSLKTNQLVPSDYWVMEDYEYLHA